MQKLGLSAFPKEGANFFRNVTMQLIEQRKQSPEVVLLTLYQVNGLSLLASFNPRLLENPSENP